MVCQINAGEEDDPLQIVTGAPNVFEGAHGAGWLWTGAGSRDRLHGQEKQDGGVTDHEKENCVVWNPLGMLCSAGELGFEDKVVPVAHKDGIWILEGEYPLGQDFAEALQLKQAVVDFEITPNRPDCLAMVRNGEGSVCNVQEAVLPIRIQRSRRKTEKANPRTMFPWKSGIRKAANAMWHVS